MDKYEYKIKSDEIKQLIAEGDYAQAAEIADTIDWRRVKSVMMLCTISDLYKINRRYEDARDMLLLAYERRPGGRTICYSLCELSIKMEDFLQAVEYYKEFVQVAPKDPGRFVLQYKLYEAQDVSLEERIEVLEELKKHDYREKWAYELAYLYHRVGLATRCVEECDELILWFGEGKYVIKAMELKMLHQPLSPEQQEKYDHRFDEQQVYQEPVQTQTEEQSYEQEASYEERAGYETQQVAEETPAYIIEQNERSQEAAVAAGTTQVYEPVQGTGEAEEMDIHVKTMDVGQYNTINLQAELAAGLKEVLEENPITHAIISPMLQGDTGVIEVPKTSEVQTEEVESEVFFGETGELADVQTGQSEILLPEEENVTAKSQEKPNEVVSENAEEQQEEIAHEESDGQQEEKPVREDAVTSTTADIVMEQMRRAQRDSAEERVLAAEPPKELAGVLLQESDGQISLVMPESENLEKQITGQMRIEDILAEWERLKKENEEKRKEEVRQHVLQQTGTMFTEFEAAVRDGLLEQLESGAVIEETESAGDTAEETEAEVEEAGLEEVEPEEAESEEDAAEETEAEVEETGLEEIEPEEDAAEETEAEVEETGLEEAEPAEDAVEEAEPEEEPEEDAAEETEAEIENKDIEELGEVEELEEIVESEAEEASSEAWKKEEVSREPSKLRALTREEKELYAPYIQSRASREQLIRAVDNITLAAYTGNVIITGEEGTDTLGLAKNIVREIQMTDGNFSGKVAKISGKTFNKKDVKATLNQLKNGALIIEKASEIKENTAKQIHKCLQQESLGIILFLEDSKKAINRFLETNEQLREAFTARIDIEALSNDALVAFGRQYAKEREYAVDELGILALHTRIEERQTSNHVVTVLEVKDIVDEAIHHANRKTLGHFFDVLLAKRYDDEDMIILTEKDFV